MTAIEPVYAAVGARIKDIRRERGWTQAALAARMSVGRNYVAQIEIGRQRILLHRVQDFAVGLKTTPKNLMRGIWW